jgi:hypothetical protein
MSKMARLYRVGGGTRWRGDGVHCTEGVSDMEIKVNLESATKAQISAIAGIIKLLRKSGWTVKPA